MFYPEMDAIKNLLRFFFLFLVCLSGRAQQVPDSVGVQLPDTVLSIENTLFLIEERTPLYFSYNPDIFAGAPTLQWGGRHYVLGEVLDRICRVQDVQYTTVGNQVVFHREGEEPVPGKPEAGPTPPGRKIRGRILGSPENESLAYATVWLKGTLEGTMANSDGYFVLNLDAGELSDTVSFSCMGYRTLSIPVSGLSDSLNRIRLQISIIPIQEVVIRRTDPVYLLRQALEKIPDNNPADPVIETAFYRETIRKNERYVSVSEAVVKVFKPGYASGSTEQVKVLRGRRNRDFSEEDTLVVKLKGGLETSFLLDIVRNRPDFLREELFHRYDYFMSDIVIIQDKSAYAIDFRQKPNTELPHYAGRIYIDLESLAFRAVEFEVDPKTISSVATSMVYKKPRKVMVRPLQAAYTVRYKSEGDRFYLSMIRADNRFRVRPRRKLLGNEFRTVSEMAVTGIQTEGVERFRFREISNPGDIFADLLGGYDPDFWGPYNYLIPEESLEDALERISRLMERAD